jgi:hypothetical protein
MEMGTRTNTKLSVIKNALIKEPELQYPAFTRPFILTTDPRGFAVGAILSQGKIGQDKPTAYAVEH